MRRYKKVVDSTQVNPYAIVPLPVNQPCAIYARQSTARQVENNRESGEMQTDDLVTKAVTLGWKREAIKVYYENLKEDGTVQSASGTLRIDERVSLSALMSQVYRDEIKAILVYNESRLFRDVWQIQVDTFIKACHEHDVRVITRDYSYDFLRRPYDTDQFQMQCKFAATYNTNHIKGVLIPERQRKAARGLFCSGGVPTGYVTTTVLIENNKTAQKLKPYAPHADVVSWLFKRYKELGGSFFKLYKEARSLPFLFPEFDGVPVPVRFHLTRQNGGYTLSRQGLKTLLTNVVYLGYWTVNGVVVSKNNHEPIIDEGDFWYAFNRLSNVTPEGHEQEMIDKPAIRFNRVTTPPIDALLKDVITGVDGRKVYVYATKRLYKIHAASKDIEGAQSSLPVALLDKAFTDRLIWRMKSEHKTGVDGDEGSIYARLRDKQQEKDTANTSIEHQITEINRRMSVLRRNLDLEDIETSVLQEWVKELKQITQVKTALEARLMEAQERKEDIAEFVTLMERVTGDWNRLTFEQKKHLVRMIAREVRLVEITHQLYRLEIEWLSPYEGVTDVAYICSTDNSHTAWTPDEDAILRTMYPTSPRGDIVLELPTRNWDSIQTRSFKLGIHRTYREKGTSSKFCVDLTTRMNALEITVKEGTQWVTSITDKAAVQS